LIALTKKGASVRFTRQSKVGMIQTKDLPGDPSNPKSLYGISKMTLCLYYFDTS